MKLLFSILLTTSLFAQTTPSSQIITITEHNGRKHRNVDAHFIENFSTIKFSLPKFIKITLINHYTFFLNFYFQKKINFFVSKLFYFFSCTYGYRFYCLPLFSYQNTSMPLIMNINGLKNSQF